MTIQNDNLSVGLKRKFVKMTTTFTTASGNELMFCFLGKIKARALILSTQNTAHSAAAATAFFRLGDFSTRNLYMSSVLQFTGTSQIAANGARRFALGTDGNGVICSAAPGGSILWFHKGVTGGGGSNGNLNCTLEYEIVDTTGSPV